MTLADVVHDLIDVAAGLKNLNSPDEVAAAHAAVDAPEPAPEPGPAPEVPPAAFGTESAPSG